MSSVQDSPLHDDRRLLAVDIIRGIAIFGVLFIHPMIYGTWQTEENALNIVPFTVVLLFLPIILMGTWGGGFLMISSLVHTYNTQHRLAQGYSMRKIVGPILATSTLLFIIDPLRAFLFGRTWTNAYSEGYNYSILSRLLEQGKLGWPEVEKIFQIGILPAIAINGYITCLLLWLLFRNNGVEKLQRNVTILLILGIGMSLISNPLNQLVHPYVTILFEKAGIYRLFAYILRFFFGAQLSYFPMGVYGIFGLAGGMLLANRSSLATIRRFGVSLGLLYLVGFVISLTITISTAANVEDAIFGILDYEIYPRELLFFSLGWMFLLFYWILKRYEYIPDELRVKRARKTLFFRRFGVATLTLYILEPVFNGIIAHIFHIIFGNPSAPFGTPDPFMSNVWAILLFVATFEIFWMVFVYFWAKSGYKYGVEYWIVRVGKNRRTIRSKRLQLETYETG